MSGRVVSLAVMLLTLGAASSAAAEDFYQGKTLSIVVGYAAGGGYDTNARLLARHVSGHIPDHPTIVVVNMPGAGTVERGELNGGCLTWASLPANWVTDKLITPVLRLSNATALGLPASVPSAYDVAANDRDRKIMRVLLAAGEVGKPFVFALGVPDDRVATMRKAFAATVKDPKFLADAEKLRQPVTPTLGEEAEKIVDEVYATPADIIEAARAVASDD